ncbi:PIN domain-containing protein [Microbacterium betulae]|uniref:Ribonuclease VapC n=1 Tax=Microbacterium betulae TaxID=2981139 RepID=A0AA97FH03_9MICO|nr:PIN domain-containing protein [Microbacterium sp. AB]WOF22738.1 PIN domain-containing protein [Microbacterium sp. AB]
MPTSAELLLDTSAALALVQPSHDRHEAVMITVKGKALGLAGHALIETYSVLTRLPGAPRVAPATAARIVRTNFPGSHALSTEGALSAVPELQAADVSGGAVYDGLVALAAREADVRLITCDRRAMPTYARLGVDALLV